MLGKLIENVVMPAAIFTLISIGLLSWLHYEREAHPVAEVEAASTPAH